MLAFFDALQHMGLFSLIRGSAYTYLAILAIHIAALVLFGGMVLVTDMRLLGIAFKSYTVPEIITGFRTPKRVGLSLAIVSGVLLFGSQAAQYTFDPWFWAKLAMLGLLVLNCLIFERSIFRGMYRDVPDQIQPARGKLKWAAVLSLVLWTGVIVAGRGPATIKDVMHSMVDPAGDYIFESIQQISDTQGLHENVPRTDAEWQDLRRRLAVLQEVPNLVRGRRAARSRDRSRNPQSESQPEDIQKALDADPVNVLRRARRLQNAATWAIREVDARNQDGLLRAIDGIDKACENCHLNYWYPNDKRAQQAAREDHIRDADTGEAPISGPDNSARPK